MSVDYDYEVDDGPQTWFSHAGRIEWDGRGAEEIVVCAESTNDNEDSGYPSEYAAWEIKVHARDGETLRQAFIRHAGGPSRRGYYGQPVTVMLDGEEIERAE